MTMSPGLRMSNPFGMCSKTRGSVYRSLSSEAVRRPRGSLPQQPTMDGAATGELSFRDFKIFSNVLKDLVNGGVVLNIGSAVIMPEIFLKALTVARNLGSKARGFTTANFDMLRHYRPMMNVVLRPTQKFGKGFDFSGHHEIMIPLLAAMVNQHLRADVRTRRP